MSGFHTITLGCKLNQFDGAAIEGELAGRGLRPEPDRRRASVVIVNTCTVTHRADAEARKLIRAVRRENPGCRLLVTGCYAELEPDELAALEGVDHVFGNREKPRIAEILNGLGIGRQRHEDASPGLALARSGGDRGCDGVPALPRAVHFGERSRAFLKVQEGCRLSCSYCVIPKVRGGSRSVPVGEVLRAARSLFDAGYREIVLTGVNTGDYGRDLTPATDLAELLARLVAICGPNRIRLNSLEPLTLTDAIVELMAGEPRLAPHVQVPLQSGSETILRRMRRNYRLDAYRERVERLRSAVPDAGIGADVIVGFPGETAELFEETYRFVEASPLNYLHVFSWSPRPGTPAAELPDRVHGAAVRERSARLRALGERLSARFRRRFVGRRLDAVVLGGRAGTKREAGARVLTGNFIEADLRAGCAEPGALIRVRIESAPADGNAVAIPDGVPGWTGTRSVVRT